MQHLLTLPSRLPLALTLALTLRLTVLVPPRNPDPDLTLALATTHSDVGVIRDGERDADVGAAGDDDVQRPRLRGAQRRAVLREAQQLVQRERVRIARCGPACHIQGVMYVTSLMAMP